MKDAIVLLRGLRELIPGVYACLMVNEEGRLVVQVLQLMVTETITVTWGGVEVRVDMRASGPTVDSGRVEGLPNLDRFNGCLGTSGEWNAYVRPCETINQGNGIEIGADGATAQEALDALAVKLREVRDWAAGVLQEPKKEGRDA